jgi:hypothetical protein
MPENLYASQEDTLQGKNYRGDLKKVSQFIVRQSPSAAQCTHIKQEHTFRRIPPGSLPLTADLT